MSQFFKPEELACHCGRKDCDAVPIDMAALMALDGVRREYGKPMRISSATRCSVQNDKVGGSPNSDHLRGEAFDVLVKDAAERARIMVLALKHGFNSVGVPKAGFLHIGRRAGPLVVFGY
jgi:uncharacterized protein YcbK (DUF882 family)